MDAVRDQLVKQKRALEERLKAINAAIIAYDSASQKSLFRREDLNQSGRRTSTIKEDALAVLRRYREGRAARQILEELNQTVRPELERETLSPQLSRLRQEGKLKYDNGIWSIFNGGANEQ